jgi:hypothetical protein
MRLLAALVAITITIWGNAGVSAAEIRVPRYHVADLAFSGPTQTARDTPARDVELTVTFRHTSGATVRALGFWNGDGQGGVDGDVFVVRFCPTEAGTWTIAETASNRDVLRGQRVGDTVVATDSPHSGLWIADGQWYRRSNGSHPYIIGNTHYSFLSRQKNDGPVATDPVDDIRRQAAYFTKLRFTLVGDRYPDPKEKPFLDDEGRPTDSGRFSLRPNPRWFHLRADPVIREAFAQDLICDLILCGPDTQDARITLKGDNAPWLRYVAARYGAYPHVWYCLCNEWNIKQPNYTADEIRTAGQVLRKALPHRSTPVSVHANTGDWDTALNGDWHDHAIIQWKLKTIDKAADATSKNVARGGGKPVVNDENAYEGAGDKFSEGDVIEGCFGTFLGGGYPTTGEKYGNKLGQYFWGGFDPKQHTAADNLQCLRRYVDKHISFWRMQPIAVDQSPFAKGPASFRVLTDRDREYVLGSNRAANVAVALPAGTWRIAQVDLMTCQQKTLVESATGEFMLATPDSRAVLTHLRRKE